MPSADNEWGEWDPSQWEVLPRGTHFPGHLKLYHSYSFSDAGDALESTWQPKGSQIPAEPYHPCLRDFRYWYIWAREIERDKKYLERIQVIATKFKSETPTAEINIYLQNPEIILAEADLNNMRTDENHYHARVIQFLNHANIILEKSARTELYEGRCVHKCYLYSRQYEYALIHDVEYKLATVERAGQLLAYQYMDTCGIGNRFIRRQDFVLFRQIANTCR